MIKRQQQLLAANDRVPAKGRTKCMPGLGIISAYPPHQREIYATFDE
jgi:hypothetical protein